MAKAEAGAILAFGLFLFVTLIALYAYAQEPWVRTVVCAETAPAEGDDWPTVREVLPDTGGERWTFFPVPLMQGAGCEGVRAVPEGEMRYHRWVDEPPVRFTVTME